MCAKNIKVSLNFLKLFRKKCRLFFRTRCIAFAAIIYKVGQKRDRFVLWLLILEVLIRSTPNLAKINDILFLT